MHAGHHPNTRTPTHPRTTYLSEPLATFLGNTRDATCLPKQTGAASGSHGAAHGVGGGTKPSATPGGARSTHGVLQRRRVGLERGRERATKVSHVPQELWHLCHGLRQRVLLPASGRVGSCGVLVLCDLALVRLEMLRPNHQEAKHR